MTGIQLRVRARYVSESLPGVMVVLVLTILWPEVISAQVVLEAQRTDALPGQVVLVHVLLHARLGQPVVAVENTLSFDADHTPLKAATDGRPACSVNTGIGKESSAFAFEPRGCGSVARTCSRIRAVVVSLRNTNPIADGSVLYSCEIAVDVGAAPGSYPLRVGDTLWADSQGNDHSAEAMHGEIRIVRPTTPTPFMTATATPPPNSVTPTSTAIPIGAADANCDRRLDAADLVEVSSRIFAGPRLCSADCNGDGKITAADVTCVAARLFRSARSMR